MRKRSLVLSFILAIFALLSTVAFVGCDVNLDTLKSSFESLDKTYQTYSEVFNHGTLAGTIETNYIVNYGDAVNIYVGKNKENYAELRDEYNVMLALSHYYIDTNKSYVLNCDYKNLSKEAKKSLNTVNKKIKEYEKEIKKFDENRKAMMVFFNQYAEAEREQSAEEYHVRMFKRAYGKLIDKNIELSSALAKSVELTEIFDLMKNTAITNKDVSIIKDYVQTKMLPIYNEFMINQVANKISWKVYEGLNSRLDNLIDNVKNSFNSYKSQIVNGATNDKEFTAEQITVLFNKVENFLAEQKIYDRALKEFDIATFVTNYNGNLQQYEKKNSLASLDLEKMEQFIQKTVPNFIEEMGEYLFN